MPFGQEKKASKKGTLLLYFTTNVQNKALEPVITQCPEQLVWMEVKIQQIHTQLLKYFNLSSAMAICLVTLFCLQHAVSSHQHNHCPFPFFDSAFFNYMFLSSSTLAVTKFNNTKSKNTINTFLKSQRICKAYAALFITERTSYQIT